MKGSRKYIVMLVALFFFLVNLIVFAIFYDKLKDIAIPFYTAVGGSLAAFFAANLGEYWLNGKK